MRKTQTLPGLIKRNMLFVIKPRDKKKKTTQRWFCPFRSKNFDVKRASRSGRANTTKKKRWLNADVEKWVTYDNNVQLKGICPAICGKVHIDSKETYVTCLVELGRNHALWLAHAQQEAVRTPATNNQQHYNKPLKKDVQNKEATSSTVPIPNHMYL